MRQEIREGSWRQVGQNESHFRHDEFKGTLSDREGVKLTWSKQCLTQIRVV